MIDIPGYTILRQIGEGGMATVYLAVQESLGRQVALKVMRSTRGNAEHFIDRFLKEARIIAQLQHPQIITIYDFGSHDGQSYFSMEFLPEGTLAQQIADGLSPERAQAIIRSICPALAYAHRQGIIHRDIKPQNILFRQDGAPVLSDFGIAKTLDADDTQLTAPGLAIGSPTYMSPEQITGKKLDNRSDLYSLGIVFYEMLVREPPYRSDDIFGIAMMHCTQPIPRLPDNVNRYQSLLQKLLAKNPTERFENAEQLLQALDQPTSKLSFHSLLPTTQFFHAFNPSPISKKIALAGALAVLVLSSGGIYLRAMRQPTPINTEALAGPPPADRAKLAAHYEQLAVQHLQNEEFGPSLELIKLGLNASPDDRGLLALRDRVERQQAAGGWLRQARQSADGGSLEQGLGQAEEGLRLVPDHPALAALRERLQVALKERRQRAERSLSQSHAYWQAGDLDASLKQIEDGLQQAPGHPELSTLRSVVESRIKERQLIPKLLSEARELARQNQLDESLKRIDQGLSLVPEQADLVSLRERVTAALEANRRIGALLRECDARFPLERLTASQGVDAVACYQQIVAFAPADGQARARIEQIADRYASLADAAIGKAEFQNAEGYLAQLQRIRPDHARLATLNRLLQVKRKQTESEARRLLETETKRQATEEARRRAAEREKNRTLQNNSRKAASEARASGANAPASAKPTPSPLAPAAQPRQAKSRTNCGEALLKAQLGEPLSAIEQKECRP
ncbi:MAG TPA: protein kinase [Candidatus Competibacter sp.]|nr:hypothetical protein [Candidatus Competibacteraceae bacterium]HRE54774.1 protein kinase [Candidatus Competibacter sp.]HUM94146.1 protein kinase [Candidatus Competibacter sp.]